MSSSAADGVDPREGAVKSYLFHPFDCGSLAAAHDSCLQQRGHWRLCAETQDALDACVEAGERRKFYIEAKCVRWKRRFQVALLERLKEDNAERFEDALSSLYYCCRDADAKHQAAERRPPR